MCIRDRSLEGEESEYVIVVTREEEAVTEPDPNPGTDKPSIPGSDEDQVGGGDWDWPSGSGSDSTTGSGLSLIHISTSQYNYKHNW